MTPSTARPTRSGAAGDVARRLLAVAQHQVTFWLDEAITLRAEAPKAARDSFPSPSSPTDLTHRWPHQRASTE